MPLNVPPSLGVFLSALDSESGPLHQAFLEGLAGSYAAEGLAGYDILSDPAIQKLLRSSWILYAAAANTQALLPWRKVGDVDQPQYLHAWQSMAELDPDYRGVEFRLEGDIVRLRGAMATGPTGAVAFILPAGYRPAFTAQIPNASAKSIDFTKVVVSPSGDVTIGGGDNSGICLDGVTFSVGA